MKHSGLTELAQMAGVSVTTAYRALNQHPYVSDRVRNKVFEAARKLHYQPPATARKKRIGVVVNNFDDPLINFYRSRVLAELASGCGRRGIGLEVIPEGDIELLEENFLRAAIIFQSSFDLRKLKECRNTKLVCLNALFDGIPGVSSDNSQAVRLGLDYLFRHQCRRIAVAIPRKMDDSVLAIRLDEYRRFCTEQALPCDDGMIIEVNLSAKDDFMRVVRERRADALFILGEDMLLQLNQFFFQCGVKVPEDISVISFENHAAAYLAPAYSTVAQDFPRLVERAVELANRILDGEDLPAGHRELIPCSLIERSSVKHGVIQ